MPSSPGNDGPGDDRAAGVAEAEQAQQDAGGQPPPQDQSTRDEAAEALARAEDRYKRALADLDNYRKRSARELERRVDEARDALLLEWLEALDSVERALRLEPGSPLLEGLRAVLEQMETILARHGVERIGAVGERFDPERHEAVGVTQSSDLPDQTVVEVARSGFAHGDRVLRPAQVIVSRRPAES